MSKISQELENLILIDCKDGLSKTEIQKKYNIGVSPINRILNQNNIIYKKSLKRQRNIGWDFSFFQKDSPDLAYIAGFLFADGSLQKRELLDDTTYNLRISLNEKDLFVIKYICNCIGLSHDRIINVPARNGDPQKMICIGHKHLDVLLKKWGIIPAKTYNFIAPEISDEMLPHFIRGWIDGDGTIKVRKGKSSYIRITGNKEALIWFIDNCSRLGFTGKIYKSEWYDYKVWGKIIIQNRKNMSWFKDKLLCDNYFCINRKWDLIDF